MMMIAAVSVGVIGGLVGLLATALLGGTLPGVLLAYALCGSVATLASFTAIGLLRARHGAGWPMLPAGGPQTGTNA